MGFRATLYFYFLLRRLDGVLVTRADLLRLPLFGRSVGFIQVVWISHIRPIFVQREQARL